MVDSAQPANVGSLYGIAHAVLHPVMSFLWQIEAEGVGHVPPRGGAIFAPNHLSVFDHFALGAALPRQIIFVGKSEYLDRWTTRYAFPALGMIPIDRSGGAASRAALDAAAGILEGGGCFGIYPEGTRSRDGDLHRGRTGVARLALRTGCPIIPVGLQGTAEVQPPDARFPKPFRHLRVRIGRPVDPRAFTPREGDVVDGVPDGEPDRALLRTLTDVVMHEIARLSGQRYVDEYA